MPAKHWWEVPELKELCNATQSNLVPGSRDADNLILAALSRSRAFFDDRPRVLIFPQTSEFRVPKVVDLRSILHPFMA